MTPAEKKGSWRHLALVPVYWVGLSVAGWRALWHLMRQPFEWEKTPHAVARVAEDASAKKEVPSPVTGDRQLPHP
jgi:glycosyltransferase XagB